MKLIESKTLATAAASIEFTSIPQDGTDLFALLSLRSSNEETAALRVYPNGSSSNLSARVLFGNGSTSTSATYTNGIGVIGGLNPVFSTSNTFANTSVYIPNYAGSTNKSISLDGVSENNATEAFQGIGALLWSSTSAITSLTFLANSGSLAIGSTISLYKITKGSDGIVTTS
jgi:hypothetical protein